MTPEEIAYEEFIDSYNCVGDIELSNKKYAILTSPRDNPEELIFRLHPFYTENYEYDDFPNDNDDILIRLDKPEYVRNSDIGKLTNDDKIILQRSLGELKDHRRLTDWESLCTPLYFCYGILTENETVPHYSLLPD